MEYVTGASLYHSHMDHNHAVLTLSGLVMGTTNGILAEGVLTDADITCSCSDMNHNTLANLRKHIEDGETYVAVHSATGEIRGDTH